jgi:hypothetical protein
LFFIFDWCCPFDGMFYNIINWTLQVVW